MLNPHNLTHNLFQTAGWCPQSNQDNVIAVNFQNGYGIKGIVVMKPNNPASYAQSVHVKYVPNDGSIVPQDFPLGTGLPLVRILLIVHVHDMQAYHLMYAISIAYAYTKSVLKTVQLCHRQLQKAYNLYLNLIYTICFKTYLPLDLFCFD